MQGKIKWLIEDIEKKYPKFIINFDWIKDWEVMEVSNHLKRIQWRFVGGLVRDSLIGKNTYDIDINTTEQPEEILKIFKDHKTSEVGKKHGTVMIFLGRYQFEITTLREDIETYGRKAKVKFNKNWQSDSNRRDFTINALMLDMKEMIIYDYHTGLDDLYNKKIIFIGNPLLRIQEDYIRIIRYIRFITRFNCTQKNNEYFSFLQENIIFLKQIAKERISKEILLIFKEKYWLLGLKIIKDLQIDSKIFNLNFNYPVRKKDYNYWTSMKKIEYKIIFIFAYYQNNQNTNFILPRYLSEILRKVDGIHQKTALDQLLFSAFKLELKYQKYFLIKLFLTFPNLIQFFEYVFYLKNQKIFINQWESLKIAILDDCSKNYRMKQQLRSILPKSFMFLFFFYLYFS